MSYPMIGDGNNDYSRTTPGWEQLYNLMLVVGIDASQGGHKALARIQGKPDHRAAVEAYLLIHRRSGNKRADNPFLMPHGGRKWGEKFTVIHYRLDKKSRRRRFVARTGAKRV